ncbi:MAG: ATP-binding protein [Verrucomicrobiota bacterium]|nr:ATP-binding protein [Verrucomicrobiota bacterium]
MIARLYSPLLQEMLQLFPVVAVVGPRQVGKSTLVSLLSDREYLSLDDITLRSTAEGDAKAFLDRTQPITVDEVQLVPGLLREIKRLSDLNRQPGRFLLTGSADLDHCADISHVLAGRVGVMRLPPITRAEETGATRWMDWLTSSSAESLDAAFTSHKSPPFDFSRLLRGGFPLSVRARTARERSLWMESFRLTYLERDLRRISDIGNLADFNRLMLLTAGLTATIVNQASLARDAGLSPATAGRHLSILEASLLIRRIPPYFINIGKRLVKSPKLFWTDTGLCSHLLGIADIKIIDSEPLLRGRLFESFVMMEVESLLSLLPTPARLHHVRTHDQLEVDGLIDCGRTKLLFEVKASRTVTAEDAASMEQWIALNPTHGPGIVIYSGTDYQPLTKNVRAIPASMLFG